MRAILLMLVVLSSGCAWMRGSTALESASFETAVPSAHQAYLAQDVLALITAKYPPATTNFRLRPAGPVGRAVANRLRQLGYGVSNTGSGQQVVYTIDPYKRHGLYLSLQIDDWRADRLYQEDFAGTLQTLSGYTIRGHDRFDDVAAAEPEPIPTPVVPPRMPPAVPLAAETQVTDVWAVQVIAGKEIEELNQHKAQLTKAGYRADVVEKPQLGLHAVQIVGLNTKTDAKTVLQAQRAGAYKDAFLVKRAQTVVKAQPLTTPTPKVSAPSGSSLIAESREAREVSAVRCERVDVKAGSLRENVKRLLDRCGYAVGNWQLGPDGYVEDWVIQRPYSVVVKDGLRGVLALLEHNYLVEGQVRAYTQTVDFRSVEGSL